MPRRLQTLRNTLTRRVLLLTLVPAVLAAMLSIAWLRHLTVASVHRQQQYVAWRAASAVESQVALARQTVRQLADLSGELDPTQTTSAIETAMRQVVALQAICALDENSVVQAVAMQPGFGGRKADLLGLDLSLILGSAPGEGAELVDRGVWTSPLTGGQVLLVVAHGNKGAILGLVDPEPLQHAMEADIPTKYFAAILDTFGTVVAQGDHPASRLGELAERGRLSASRVYERTWEKVPYVVATTRAMTTPWHVAVGTTEQNAMAGLANAEAWTIAGALLIAAGAGAAGVWVARRSVRPITRLANDVRDVERSGEHHVSGEGFAETEFIAQCVRQMALSLRERESRLQHLAWTIESAARGSEHLQGQPYMAGLVADLLLATKARCIIAAEWIEGAKPRARIIAAKTSVALQEDYTYELGGHPSHRVADRDLLYVRTGVPRLYPESPLLRLTGADGYIALPLVLSDGNVGGHIEIIDDHEIILDEHLRNLLLLLATRGSAELQRMHAERQVLKSDLLYATVNLDQDEIVARWVIDGTITFVNDAFCRFAQQERSSLIGRSLLSFVPEAEQERFRNRALELSAVVPTRRFDQQLLDGGGELHWFDWHYRGIPDAKGRIIEYQGTGREITQLRDVMTELEESRNLFAALADNTETAFWVTEAATHKCLYANARFEEIWGITQQQMIEAPMTWSEAIHESERAGVVRNFLLHAAEGQYAETYQVVRPDQSVRRVRDRAVALRRSDGRVYLIANVAVDITHSAAGRALTV